MQKNSLDELKYEFEVENYLRSALRDCQQLKPPLARFFASIEEALNKQRFEETCNELLGV